MTTASERIPLVGLSLADAYEITDQLRARTMILRDAACAFRAEGGDDIAFTIERERVLALRDKVSDAITKTLGDLG